LQRGRCSSDNANRSVKHKSISSCPSPSRVTTKSKAITIERLQAELNDRDDLISELKTKLDDNSDSETGGLKLENIRLKEKLEQTEQLLNECRAQLHTRTLQASAHNSKN
ncbi:unnamed protein product, partial [Rotaria magnacalcarata]